MTNQTELEIIKNRAVGLARASLEVFTPMMFPECWDGPMKSIEEWVAFNEGLIAEVAGEMQNSGKFPSTSLEEMIVVFEEQFRQQDLKKVNEAFFRDDVLFF